MTHKKDNFVRSKALVIENDINYLDIERLEELLSEESDINLIIIFRNITAGRFSYAFRMGEMLFHSNKKITIICEGQINLTGIIPIISTNSVLTAAKENASFLINARDYIKKFCGTEDKNIAMELIKESFINCTNLHEIELAFLLNGNNIIDVDTAYKYGIINDIYRSNFVKDITSPNSIQRFQRDSNLTFERGYREQFKSNNQTSYINFSLN